MCTLELDLRGLSGTALDSLQSLRSAIMYTNDTKAVAFTSTSPSEGKSVLSFYTAISFASLNKKTLFIDCDMRKSSIRKYFNIKSDGEQDIKGLSEHITGQNDELVYETNYPNLHMIPCGKCPPDPSGILSSSAFEKIVEDAKKEYDYVIIDTPPVSVATDACIVGRKADGVMYVVKDSMIKSRDAKHCVDVLERNDCKIIGIVSNMVAKASTSSYYYGGYGYYNND